MVDCLERDADLHMAQLMPLPLSVSCFSKIQIGFTFLVPAYLGSPGKRAVKLVCVCVLFWHTPLGVCSAICRHQPPQRTVLGQVDCFIQCEVVGSEIALDGVQQCDARTPWWSFQVGGAIRIILASVSSSIRAICLNMERRRDWIVAVRLGRLVILLVSLLRTDWCHLIPTIVLKP